MSCLIVCIAFVFYVFVLNLFLCITVLYCIDVCLSHLNKDYLLNYINKVCLFPLEVYSILACVGNDVNAKKDNGVHINQY